MTFAVFGRSVVLAVVTMTALPADAITIGGGGSKSTDCLLALQADANYPVGNEKQVRCIDGDPACDDDLTVNGICNLRVAVCANSTFNPSECTLSGLASVTVEHAVDTPLDPKFDPDFLALQGRINNDFSFPVGSSNNCTTPVLIGVNIKGPLGNNNRCSRQKKKLKIRSLSTSGPQGVKEDKDTLKLYCDPAPVNGCDPQTLFTGTFDRIQKQIFKQSCALSSCHDSNMVAGNLLLEPGSSYTNLINQVPDNDSAQGQGWLRVDVVPNVSGDPANSFLFHKLEGSLPDASFGDRMPRNRPKLNGTLRDIIEQWINAGAPQTGWVPGTF
jgi:hypothetical protein